MIVKQLNKETEIYLMQLPEFYVSVLHGFTRDYNYFRDIFNSKNKGVFLGLEKENLEATLEYSCHNDGDLKIGDILWVLARIKGEGRGSKLLEYSLNFFRKENLDIAALTVSKSNLKAIRLYEKFGFKYFLNRENNSVIYAQALSEKGKEVI